MSEQHHHTEARLRALFDATAVEPDRETLDRLARGAARIPERRGWAATSLWAFGLAAAASLALWLALERGFEQPSTAARVLPHPTVAWEQPLEVPPIDEVALEDEDDDGLLLVVGDDAALDEGLIVDSPLAALEASPFESPLALLDLLAVPEDPATRERWSSALARVR
jgi:hypothetical protein